MPDELSLFVTKGFDHLLLMHITNAKGKYFISSNKPSFNIMIERNPDIMPGKPVIKGTRITVELVMRKLAEGYSIEELLKSYPHLTRETILAALEFVADMIAHEETIENQ